MELVRVRITKTVITARYGALSPGDLLNTDLPFAKHLVDDCGAAIFTENVSQESSNDTAKQKKGKRK